MPPVGVLCLSYVDVLGFFSFLHWVRVCRCTTGPLICHFSCTLHVSIIMYSHRIDANGFFLCSIVTFSTYLSHFIYVVLFWFIMPHANGDIETGKTLSPYYRGRSNTTNNNNGKTQSSIIPACVWNCGWMDEWMDWMRYSFCCVCFFFRHLNTCVYPYICFRLSFALFSCIVFAWAILVQPEGT